MNGSKPTVVLAHGAYAESNSWNGVIERLAAQGYTSLAAAVPLRSVKTDSEYLASVVDGVGGPVLLVGHSYGGLLISQAAIGKTNVTGLVYVCAYAPESGESGADLSGKFPGGTLAPTLVTFPLPDGSNDTYIDPAKYHDQFCADVPADVAALMAATQRPIPDRALNEGASGDTQAWKTLPSWFVFGDLDKNIPVAAHRFMAERAGALRTEEVAGASHVVGISNPDIVTDVILEALRAAKTQGN
jgi:pimeloyl-ACP methyl ester carboxylesterase